MRIKNTWMAGKVIPLIEELPVNPPHGGDRRSGNIANLAKESIKAARRDGGKLPHEFLLAVARGEVIKQQSVDKDGVIVDTYLVADIGARLEAAKAAAPYYAPKISAVELIAGVSDDDLDEFIASAAAQAGVSVSAAGEGKTEEAPRPSRRRARLRSATDVPDDTEFGT